MPRAVVLALALASAAILAGCSKAPEPTDGGDVNATTSTSTSTTTTTTTPGGTNTTAPGALAPKDVCSISIDFTPSGPPADPTQATAPTQTKPCPGVPTGYKTITMTVTWSLGSAPAFVGPAAPTVKLVDPAKASIATCTGPNTGDQAAPKPCAASGSGAPAAGDYSVVGTGSGTASAKIVVSVA